MYTVKNVYTVKKCSGSRSQLEGNFSGNFSTESAESFTSGKFCYRKIAGSFLSLLHFW